LGRIGRCFSSSSCDAKAVLTTLRANDRIRPVATLRVQGATHRRHAGNSRGRSDALSTVQESRVYIINMKHLIHFGQTAVPAMLLLVAILLAFGPGEGLAAAPIADAAGNFPRGLDSYADSGTPGLLAVLANRIEIEPFNLIASLIFLAAITHTFLTSFFLGISRRWQLEHERAKAEGSVPRHSVHHGAELLHFLGEVEVVFGIWAVVLVAAITLFHDWGTAAGYIVRRVDFTEAMFVVVIMTLAATRPILKLTESLMSWVAGLFGGSVTAWWMTILSLGPVLGSFITEPAAMTLSALLLSDKFYELNPCTRLKYATIGLLFVNVSVGGTLTHFAAPPVLMVAGHWGWNMSHMFLLFGWKAVVGIILANGLYCVAFRAEFARLQERFEPRVLRAEIRRRYLGRDAMEDELDAAIDSVNEELDARGVIEEKIREVTEKVKERLKSQYLDRLQARGIKPELALKAFEKRFEEVRLSRMRRYLPGLLPREQRAAFHDPEWDCREDPVPAWVTLIHVIFLVWTIVNAHYPQFFLAGMLFFLGFARVTESYQNRIDLKQPLLVGFFLAGLVIHGGLQGWWISPALSRLGELPLMTVATVLTAFNDNAAITFLSTLVPDFSESLKYCVVAGAVIGGGMTVIANAPNPAGQSLLKHYFENGVSPVGLMVAALAPTTIFFLLFALLR